MFSNNSFCGFDLHTEVKLCTHRRGRCPHRPVLKFSTHAKNTHNRRGAPLRAPVVRFHTATSFWSVHYHCFSNACMFISFIKKKRTKEITQGRRGFDPPIPLENPRTLNDQTGHHTCRNCLTAHTPYITAFRASGITSEMILNAERPPFGFPLSGRIACNNHVLARQKISFSPIAPIPYNRRGRCA